MYRLTEEPFLNNCARPGAASTHATHEEPVEDLGVRSVPAAILANLTFLPRYMARLVDDCRTD